MIDTRGETKRLNHFTPLRYPGGKGKLAPFVKEVLRRNELGDAVYAEPYAGGAAIAMELLLQEFVSEVWVNDISAHVHAFWRAVVDHGEELADRVLKAKLTVSNWDQQKRIVMNPAGHGVFELGFATFFLNRTNRSGILNGGMIGGRAQTGEWKLDARFNAVELARRIAAIHKLRSRIKVSRLDAAKFLSKCARQLPPRSLVYLDPPYYVKGKELYPNYYNHVDHAEISELVQTSLSSAWLVTYDDVPEIRRMYRSARRKRYSLGYSARQHGRGNEIMFCPREVELPQILPPLGRPVDKHGDVRNG